MYLTVSFAKRLRQAEMLVATSPVVVCAWTVDGSIGHGLQGAVG